VKELVKVYVNKPTFNTTESKSCSIKILILKINVQEKSIVIL